MREDLYEEMYWLEDAYWWHVAKRNLVKSLVREHLEDRSNRVFVDVGCGTGRLIAEVKSWGRWRAIIGIDGSTAALGFCQKRGRASFVQTDFEAGLPVDSEAVDLVTSLDVVEHIENDEELLAEFYRVLRPNGLVIITVPAYKKLWTYWDDVLGHKRRYEKKVLERKLRKAGFRIEKISYFYSYLLPLALFVRSIKSCSDEWKKNSDFVRVPTLVNQVLLGLARMELELLKRVGLPAGLSLVCVGRKQ